MQVANIIWTIEELYEWAVANGVEGYTVFGEEEGCRKNLYANDININHKEETIDL